MRRSLIIFLLLLFSQIFCSAQIKKQLDSLCVMCNHYTSDSDKVVALGKLADLYYTYKLNRQGDSVLHEQLLLAELSDKNNLVLIALFGDAITNVSPNTTTESFDKIVEFLGKGIDYAKAQNLYDYIALGYTRLSNVLRNRGQYDKALYNASHALQYMPNIKSDSIKAVVYIELGNAYHLKGEEVAACTNYNNAFDIALRIKSYPLQSSIYHCFCEIYVLLGDDDVAKDELKKSLALNRENNYWEGMIRDYYDMAKVTGEKFYLDKGIKLSDSIHSFKYILQLKRLRFYFYMVAEKNKNNIALNYLENEPDIKESYSNIGISNYYRAKGQVYFYSENYDSALYYFKFAEQDYLNSFDEKLGSQLLKEIAESYQKLKNIPGAIEYYTKALYLNKKMNDAGSIALVSEKLSEFYEMQGDYKQAFVFSKQATQFKDSLRNLSKGRDIALLGVDREKRKHEEDLKEENRKSNNQRDLQYMAITIAIGVVFILMLVIGMFPVSRGTIRMLGYFFFISLFEFIVMVIDNSFLARVVHNEPLKLWIIKIVLIAMLVPVQHFLEHNLIKFLESRKLIEARTKFSLKKWWKNVKKPVPANNTSIEEDTAVL